MPPRENENIYNKLSLVYSHLMRNIRYDLWAAYLYNISKKYIKKHGYVLELGSGSGLLTLHLIKYYKNITMTDISLSMLKSNQTKGNSVVCDMTHLPFNRKYDLIFSAFDSVNYLLTELKLLRLFKEVELVLEDSGIFLFDVSLERNSFKHSKVPYSRGIHKGVKYLNKSEYNPSTRIHTNIFEISEGHSTYKEIHKQKIFPFETYFRLLEKTGLYVSQCFDGFTFNEGNSECDRVQFIIKKRMKNADL